MINLKDHTPFLKDDALKKHERVRMQLYTKLLHREVTELDRKRRQSINQCLNEVLRK